ncbi:hypothetical protein [Microbacterium sp. RU33B]|nr:hypothetical protein [Microbacterium sp. RU33B]SIT71541.1 hypothetical protein SAMN05880545_0882 [Microbacterium sp. RU33B]
MATSNLPTPSLQPLQTLPQAGDDKNLLVALDEGASCCGGGCCSTD